MFYARPPSALHFRIFRIAEVEIPTVQRQRPTFPWQQWKSGEVALTGSDLCVASPGVIETAPSFHAFRHRGGRSMAQ